MDSGVVGRIGPIAVRHVMMEKEQDFEYVTGQRPLMAENLVQAVQMIKARVS